MTSPSPSASTPRRAPHELLGLTSPAYGGDYNPEQWDEATFAEDLELMAEAGVNLVSLGIFSWARLEPREGVYELDWLVEIIDRLHEAGIAVDLATATASPPAWMATDHPESLPMNADGVRLGLGSRQQYCPSSAVYRECSAALAAALAERLGDHPGVVMWHIGNEYGCHIAECFCPACARAFRAWLADRYGDVERLNAAWGTDFWSQRYTSLEQVAPPAAMPTFPNPAQMLDWRRFSDHQLRSLMEAEARILRERSTRPVTTNFMGDFPATDYWRWAEALDIISDDSYPDPADPAAAHEVAWAGDLMRGLAEGRPWILMEQAPSAVQWRRRPSVPASSSCGHWPAWPTAPTASCSSSGASPARVPRPSTPAWSPTPGVTAAPGRRPWPPGRRSLASDRSWGSRCGPRRPSSWTGRASGP